jgi:hypothetical protein
MTTPAVIPNVGSATGPSLAAYGDHLWAVWRGAGDDQAVWWSRVAVDDPDGWRDAPWEPQQVIPGARSRTGPCLANVGSNVLAAWRGPDADQSVFFSLKTDDSSWSGPTPIPGIGSSEGPSAAVFSDRLRLVWRGIEGDTAVWTTDSASVDGPFTPQDWLPFAHTSVSPQIAAWATEAYVVWNGDGTNGWTGLQWTRGTPGPHGRPAWTTLQPLAPGAQTTRPPALAYDPRQNGLLWAVWRGDGPDDGLHYASINYGAAAWRVGGKLPLYPGWRVSLAGYRDRMYAAWHEPANDTIMWAQLPELHP